MTHRFLLLTALFGVLTGCSFFRGNPLAQNRGAVVLLFDSRNGTDFRSVRKTLEPYGAKATFFQAGNFRGGALGQLRDLLYYGHVIGLSGLHGADPKTQIEMFGAQKYYQDEVVMQVLDAQSRGFDAPYFAYPIEKGTPEADAMLIAKGFRKVVSTYKDVPVPVAKAEGMKPKLQAYVLTEEEFDPSLLPRLAERNELLIVTPAFGVLTNLLEAATAARVPFATLDDL